MLAELMRLKYSVAIAGAHGKTTTTTMVATLLDEGEYLCSERTMYRVLAANQPVRERRNQREHPAHDGPYSIAVVELDEGPRMMTNIINCEQTPEALQLDMPVEVVFEPISDEISLPYFQPEGASQ